MRYVMLDFKSFLRYAFNIFWLGGFVDINLYIYNIYIFICMYVYIYREGERERGMHVSLFIQVFPYKANASYLYNTSYLYNRFQCFFSSDWLLHLFWESKTDPRSQPAEEQDSELFLESDLENNEEQKQDLQFRECFFVCKGTIRSKTNPNTNINSLRRIFRHLLNGSETCQRVYCLPRASKLVRQ